MTPNATYSDYPGNGKVHKLFHAQINALRNLTKILGFKPDDKLNEEEIILCTKLIKLLAFKDTYPIRVAAAISALDLLLTEWREITPISILGNISKRDDREVSQWRKKCLERDHYKCVNCGSDKYLSVHHIFNWAEFPELRLKMDNGICLCGDCHHKAHPNIAKELFINKQRKNSDA